MVLPAKLAGLLDRHNIFTLLNDTDQRVVATWISTDSTEVLFRDISTLNTELNALLYGAKNISQSSDIYAFGLDDVECNALCGFWSDTWQTAELVD